MSTISSQYFLGFFVSYLRCLLLVFTTFLYFERILVSYLCSILFIIMLWFLRALLFSLIVMFLFSSTLFHFILFALVLLLVLICIVSFTSVYQPCCFPRLMSLIFSYYLLFTLILLRLALSYCFTLYS